TRRGGIHVSYFCDDPKGKGHQPARDNGKLPAGTPSDQEAKAQRREVRTNNDIWRSAEKVRIAWLRDFLQRKEAPKDALRLVFEAVASGDANFRRAMERSHQTARDLLGIDKPDVVYGPDRVKALMDVLGQASDGRA